MCGFQHEVWRKQFFPDDLPEDWYFDYYANEFDALLLNSDEQKHHGADALNEMLADADAEFIFVLEDCDEAQMLNWKNSACEIFFVKFVFSQIAVSGLNDKIRFEQAEIDQEKNAQKKTSKTACVLRVTSNEPVTNTDLKQILQHIQANFTGYDHVCLFLGQRMQDVNAVNAAKIINDLL